MFFKRSQQTLATINNHTPTQLAFAIQDGHWQAFWYCIRFHDGSWHELDVRWLGIEQEEWMQKVIRNHDLSHVAELIQSVDVFSLIREREAQA